MKNCKPAINAYADCLRDIADQEYIAARILYRYELDHPSLWCALQAVEKYLKAILLYNEQDTRDIGHNIVKALERVKAISDLNFTVPQDVEDFVKYLYAFGQDRYLVQEFVVLDDYLFNLDKTVWYIRRYCYHIRGKKNEMLPINLQLINNSEFIKKPWKYELPPAHKGYLEKKVKEKNLPSKEALLWNNNYFAEPKPGQTFFKERILIEESPLELHPECFIRFKELIKMSKHIEHHVLKLFLRDLTNNFVKSLYDIANKLPLEEREIKEKLKKLTISILINTIKACSESDNKSKKDLVKSAKEALKEVEILLQMSLYMNILAKEYVERIDDILQKVKILLDELSSKKCRNK